MRNEMKSAFGGKREISTTWGLIAIFGATVILFGGALTYYYQMSPTTHDYEVDSYPVPAKKVSTDATKDWKTYENTDYGLSFKYPKEWPNPQSTMNLKNDPGIVDSLFLDFNNKDLSKELRYYIELSKMADYLPTQKGAVALKKVFSDQKAGDDIAWLPPGNAMMISYSKPIYIATADKKFRGITYFANTGQDINYGIDCFSVLTDGTNIFQFHVMDSESSQAKELTGKAQDKSAQTEYTNYIKGLTLGSTTEPIVADYNNLYSLISKSLASVKAKDATPDWQTYTNSDYGFSIKYPKAMTAKDWISVIKGTPDSAKSNSEMLSMVGFGKNDTEFDNDFSVTVTTKTLETERNLLGYSVPYAKTEDIIVDGITGIKATGHGVQEDGDIQRDYEIILLAKNNNVYKIYMTSENKTLFEKIITTFQFTK